MDLALVVALGVIAALLLLVLLGVLLAVVLSGRRSLNGQLAASQADVDALRVRLEQLAAPAPDRAPALESDYLITTAGVPVDDGVVVPDRAVLSATLGEPLVKLVAFGYGVRRALSAENRNRISFEMRREVRRSRKQRHRNLRTAQRTTQRAAQRTTERATQEPAA